MENKRKRVAFDLDGIICAEPKWLSHIFYISPKIGVILRHYLPLLYRPKIKKYSIITGRPEEDRLITQKWLQKYHIGYDTLAMIPSFNIVQALLFKADLINELHISIYVESDLNNILMLERLLPNKAILNVKEGLEEGLLKC
jgi:uncharacterized HAD superfamily protein